MRSQCRNWEKTTRQYSCSLPNCSKRKRRNPWMIRETFRKWNRIIVGKVVSRSQSTCDDSEFSCFAQSRQRIAAWYLESIWIIGKRFWKTIFYVWFTHWLFSKNWEAVPKAGRTNTIHASEDKQNQGTIPMLTFAPRPLTTSSTTPVELPQNYLVRQHRQQMSELQFDKFLNPQSFLVWNVRFKTQVTSCSDFPSDALLWIKEEEMVDSLDEL